MPLPARIRQQGTSSTPVAVVQRGSAVALEQTSDRQANAIQQAQSSADAAARANVLGNHKVFEAVVMTAGQHCVVTHGLGGFSGYIPCRIRQGVGATAPRFAEVNQDSSLDKFQVTLVADQPCTVDWLVFR